MTDSLLQKITSNESNKVVLDFLGYSNLEELYLIHLNEKKYFTHEVLEDFLKLRVPIETKYILNNHGIFVHPKTGEIFTFQFWRTEMAFKNKQTNLERMIDRLFTKRKKRQNYFSNDAGDDVIDATELGQDWAIHINFIDSYEERMINYYDSIRST